MALDLTIETQALLVKAFAVWVFIAFGEIVNGNIRVRWLQRKYGRRRAKNLGFFIGIAIFSTITWFFLPWVGPSGLDQCFVIGLLWTTLMILLDLYFGRYVFHYSWQKIAEDFNPLKGNLLSLGMLLLFLCPAVVFLMQM